MEQSIDVENSSSNTQKRKNVMLSGNIARSLGIARGIGRDTSSHVPIPKNIDEDKENTNRHTEHR